MDWSFKVFRFFYWSFVVSKKGYSIALSCSILLGLLASCTGKEHLDVTYKFEVARDVEYGVDDVDKIQFTPLQHLDLGFYEGSVCIKLEIENTEKSRTLVVLCGDLINRNYHFYKLDTVKNMIVALKTVKNFAYQDHRTYNFPKPNFQIDLEPNEKCTYFLYTTSDGRILQASPRLMSFTEFQSIKQQTVAFDIVFYGSIAILLFVNFFYFQHERSNIYYFYVPYIFSACIMYLFVEGRLYGLGLSNSVIDHLMFISIRIWILLGILFTIRFLKIRKSSAAFYKFIIGALLTTLGVTTLYQLAFPGTSISNLHMTENLLGFVWIILSLTMVGISWKKQKLESKYFLIAYSTFLMFVTLGLIDSHTTILPGDPFSYFKIGTILEFTGFTYFIIVLIKQRLQTNEQLKKELTETRAALVEKEQQLVTNSNIKKTDFANIFKLIESSLATTDDWDEFKVRFDALQPNFYSRLVNACSELTKSEIRLLILIYIGYSQKEIAEMLNIAPDSVKKNRTRVRKKLKVPVAVQLEDFLHQFSQK